MEKDMVIDMAFVNFEKVFEMLDDKILLQKCPSFQAASPDNFNPLSKSKKKLFCRDQNSFSEAGVINCIFPQRSVVESLLYISLALL